ncbi:DNA-binding transcriptional repressor PuuR [Enhygromyxa salina]|uniref:DNA-binding transcriptional repressor PuuR n=1 Tax=Enhygromyxa salina TaxID=215803 RepID=A0A2S9XKG4_9BACT|nr:helix-turn-helix transcriptional regulator [Enhygromyxa salina]PRP93378.1 DNA-binding transcriptional repressor PuuR [Enhygromyxa salina]
MGKTKTTDPTTLMFGRTLKRLRRARRMTQEDLGEASGLASDTIRRIEIHDVSPRLATLAMIARGLGLPISTMFEALDLAELDVEREIVRAARPLTPAERALAPRVLRTIAALFEAAVEADDGQ